MPPSERSIGKHNVSCESRNHFDTSKEMMLQDEGNTVRRESTQMGKARSAGKKRKIKGGMGIEEKDYFNGYSVDCLDIGDI